MFLIVNLKTYAQGTGRKARELGEAAREIEDETGARIAISPQPTDVHRVAETGAETFAQHIDPVDPGSNTGSNLVDAFSAAGATGTLLNHSENRLKLADIDGALRQARSEDFETVVCANNPHQSGAVSVLGPDYVAVEPPELIGTGTPVSQADPDIVADAVEEVERHSDAELLCGAGISTGEDVKSALELGAEGVLVASGVVKAEDPKEAMRDLVTA